MLELLSSTQFAEWMAYSAVEPWGEDVEWMRHGIRASLAANAVRDPKHRPHAFTPEDFMPRRTATPADDEVDRLARLRERMRELTDRFNTKRQPVPVAVA